MSTVSTTARRVAPTARAALHTLTNAAAGKMLREAFAAVGAPLTKPSESDLRAVLAHLKGQS